MLKDGAALVPGAWTRRIAAVALAGALTLGGVATVAAQTGPDGTPVGPPENIPAGPPEGVGEQSENGNGGPPEGVGRPDGVGAAGNDGRPDLSQLLPDQASDQARAALDAVGERHQAIADRLEAMRDIPPGPDRGAAVSEIAKEFGEQMKDIAATLTEDIEALDLDDEEDDDDEE